MVSASQSSEAPSDGTRRRILQAGLRSFAAEGYAGATTRMIASGAGVTLPAIAYHFGNKEGLHRACAEAIVIGYHAHMLPLAVAAREAADSSSLSADAARSWLDQLIESLVAAVSAGPEERLATHFALRELREPGPGYELLMRELWKPGILLVADLIARARGEKSASEQDRVGALMLLSSLSAFSILAPVALAVTGWGDVTGEHHATIAARARQLLDGLLAPGS
jgi:AcrR family transcriptional regulator